MADIFVSYDSTDRERIEPLVDALVAEGWSVWWDRELALGSSFDERIEEELDNARCVIVAWSASSIGSRWCRNEANEGLERGILIPVRIDDVRPPLAFRSAQTASLIGWPRARGELDDVVSGVRQRLGLPLPDAVSLPWRQEESSESVIAVLPFENLSAGPEQDYFSDGIAEDILNELAKGVDLIVRPRSSSFALRAESLDIPAIGKRLNATHVLEGSVRRSGERVRVTVQLSDVDSNRPIWSERYDRNLTDIFAVQDEITGEVLRALNAHLHTRRSPRQFVGSEAFNAFLRARHHLAQWEFSLALEWFEKATRLDPSNADAWAGLARILDMRGPHRGQSLHDHREQMEAHFDRVLAIDPTHPQALARRAESSFFRDREYQSSIDRLAALVNANPNHEEALRSLSWLLRAIGRTELYLRTTQRMVEISPLSREAMVNRIFSYLNTGRVAEARQAVEELSRLQVKEDPLSAAWLAILDRDSDFLQAVIDRNTDVDSWNFPFHRIWMTAMVPYLKGDFDQAREIIAVRKGGSRAPTNLEKWMIALIEQDFDAALDHYATALESGFWFAFVRAHLDYPLRQTFPEFCEGSRYNQLLERFGLDAALTAALKVPELTFST